MIDQLQQTKSTSADQQTTNDRFTMSQDLTSSEANVCTASSKEEAERLRHILLLFRWDDMGFCPFVYRNSDSSYLIAVSTEFGNRPHPNALKAIDEMLCQTLCK